MTKTAPLAAMLSKECLETVGLSGKKLIINFSALAIIAKDDKLIAGEKDFTKLQNLPLDQVLKKLNSGIYPPIFHFLQKCGIYVLRFFKNLKVTNLK